MKGFSKYLVENHVPKYFIMGLVAVKLCMIYDKSKTIVAINQMNASIILLKGEELRPHFSSEQES